MSHNKRYGGIVMRQWGDLNNNEKSTRIIIGLIILLVVFGGMGAIALISKPTGYQAEKDTRPVFGQEDR